MGSVRARLTILLVAFVALVACVGAGAAVATAAPQVFVKASIDTNELTVRPHAILLSGDGTLSLYAIHYESYGGAVAKATGRAYTRGCTPNCAEGKVRRPRATIRFSDQVKCEGKLVYGEVSYVLRGPLLKGYKRRESFDLRPISEMGEPVC
jgi:hypothetical protein